MKEIDRRKFEGRTLDDELVYDPKKIKTEHTVAAGETLSEIALKYYGSAVKDKWMKIYEANKAVIGENPNLIRPGQVLKIPELE
jgi:nucleoid-associated protein YgaU